jgi:hypothetical protein
LGEIPDTFGVGLITEKLTAADAPPPGLGFVTVTEAASPAVRADAGICAEIEVPLA